MSVRYSFLTICLFFFPLQATASEKCIFVTVGLYHSFWKSVIRGSKVAGEELGYEIIDRSVFHKKEDKSLTSQKKILLWNANSAKCKGVVIAPESFAIEETIKKLKEDNSILTVYVDRDDGNKNTVGSVTTNNKQAGARAAEEMLSLLGKGRPVAVFKEVENVKTTADRVEGFIEKAKELGLKIVTEVYIGDVYGVAKSNSEALLKQYPNIEGIFTPNEITTVGTAISISKLGLKTKLIGFDINKRIYREIQKGNVTGTILQDPYKMGYESVKVLDRAIKGEKSRQRNFTAVHFLFSENIKEEKSINAMRSYGVEP